MTYMAFAAVKGELEQRLAKDNLYQAVYDMVMDAYDAGYEDGREDEEEGN